MHPPICRRTPSIDIDIDIDIHVGISIGIGIGIDGSACVNGGALSSS